MWSLYYYCMLVLSVMTARQWIWHWKWMCIRTKVKTFFMGTKLKISILKLLWECFLWFTKLLCINTCKMLLHDQRRCSCLSFMMISVFVYFFVPWFLIFDFWSKYCMTFVRFHRIFLQKMNIEKMRHVFFTYPPFFSLYHDFFYSSYMLSIYAVVYMASRVMYGCGTFVCYKIISNHTLSGTLV